MQFNRCLRTAIYVSLLLISLLSEPYVYSQPYKVHTQHLFDNDMFEHLESEYLWHHINVLSFDFSQWVQPTQLALSEQKQYTYYKIAELENKKSHALYDLKKIVFSQSEFYFSEISSYHLANYYFNQQAYELALDYIKLTSPFSLDNVKWEQLSFEKAYCLYKTKEYKKAYELFQKLQASITNTRKSYAQFYSGYLAYLFGDYTSAIRELRGIASQSPFDKVAPLVLAQALFQQEKYKNILALDEELPLSATADSITQNAWNVLMGYSAYTTQNYQKAVAYYDNTNIKKTKESKLLPALYQYSYACYKIGQLDAAQKQLELLFTSAPSQTILSYETAFLLASVYLDQGKKQDARKLYATVNHSLDNSQKRIIASTTYSKLSLELGYIEDALIALERLYQGRKILAKKNEVTDLFAQALALSKDYIKSYELIHAIKTPSTNLQKLIPTVNVHYGMWLIQNNDYQKADSLIEHTTHNPYATQTILTEAYFWLAEISLAKSNYQKAINYLELYKNTADKITKKRKQQLNYNSGYAYKQLNRYKKALSFFQKITPFWTSTKGKEAWEIDAFLFRTDCHLMLKHYAKAYSDYQKLIRDPNQYSDYAYYQNCQIIGFQDANEKEQMIDQFERYYPQSPYLYKALFEKVELQMNSKRYQEAIVLLEKIDQATQTKNINVAKTDILLQLALAHYNTKSLYVADSLYKHIITKFPQTEAQKEALLNLKTISVNSNRTDAFYDFLTSINYTVDEAQKDSLDFAVITNILLTKSSDAKIEKSLNSYTYKHPLGKHTPRAYFMLAELKKKNKQWEKAVNNYQHVIQLKKNDYTTQSLYSLSKILFFELKKYNQAKEIFKKIVDKSENANEIKEALRGLLRIYYQNKNWGRASTTAQELETYPLYTEEDNDLTHIAYAKQFQLEKQYDAALLHYQDINEQSYYYPEAQYEMARIYFRTDSLEKAKAVALSVSKLKTPNTFWNMRTYMLLGEIFMRENDLFNAKATWGSIATYAKDSTVVKQATEKLAEIDILEEARN